MRHGRRESDIDAPLLGYNSTRLDNSSPEIWQSMRQLVQQGLPVRQIISSPYLRTRQTALIVQHSYLKLTGNYLPITIDNRLGEYSHRHCRLFAPAPSDFDKETMTHYNGRVPLSRESPDALVQRVLQFSTQLPQETIVITHYCIAELLGIITRQEVKLQEGQYTVLVPVGQATQMQLINSTHT